MRAIGIDTLKKYVEYLGAKHVSGGYLPPDDFNRVMPILVNKIVRKYYGTPEEYQPGSPQPKIAYEITQLVTDYISQLREEYYMSVNAAGVGVKPPDYLHHSSLAGSFTSFEDAADDEEVTAKCCNKPTVQMSKADLAIISNVIMDMKWVPITVVPEKDRWAWQQSSLRTPTKQYPIASYMKSDTLQFYPIDVNAAILTYLRYPITAKWGYTIADGIPVYDAGTSTNVELPDICMDELAVTILDRLGIAIREPGLVEWSKYIKQTGM